MAMGDDEFLIYKLENESKLEENYQMKKRSLYHKILQIEIY